MSHSADINTVSKFISQEDIPDLRKIEPVDTIILCVCSVLLSCETVFEIIQERPGITKTLVLCGGIGHSTTFIYEAVARHPRFRAIIPEVQGLPEAQVLLAIFNHFFAPGFTAERPPPRILVEDRSVTCHTNASETRKLLEASGVPTPVSAVVVQDPTMVRRTVACFERVYEDLANPPKFVGCPVFVPLVRPVGDDKLVYAAPDIAPELMWDMDRFLDLILGEYPRLRDDKSGYGPNGNHTIVHVDIPPEVEEAWKRLSEKFTTLRSVKLQNQAQH
ncbi:hypothetical protein KVR01_012276 [Diaporthe batatas]|uniref:uncharacterized protein n=1 Tax=Diaporthe batatas TaxID=748121 RepID=UPI001D05A3D6|nr:uncharacterized protein KVR01_012276 [Diaporthe batatas]KAG8158004.1 hypothetical protein KVR01_012276 [Diaporthe batatas]